MSAWQLFEVGEVQLTFFAKLLESYLQWKGGKKKKKARRRPPEDYKWHSSPRHIAAVLFNQTPAIAYNSQSLRSTSVSM